MILKRCFHMSASWIVSQRISVSGLVEFRTIHAHSWTRRRAWSDSWATGGMFSAAGIWR